MTLARQWRGQERFEEVWFLQALIGPDRGLWLRWVIDATAGEAQVWALVSTRDGGLEAHRETVPLASLGGALFEAGPGRLERDVAVGRCGPSRAARRGPCACRSAAAVRWPASGPPAGAAQPCREVGPVASPWPAGGAAPRLR